MVKKTLVSSVPAAKALDQSASLLILSARCRKQQRAFDERCGDLQEPIGGAAVGAYAAQANMHSMRELALCSYLAAPDRMTVPKTFKIHDRVSWNSEAGRVSGTIIRVHTRKFELKGYTHHASPDDPQYEIKSSKTDHIAFHKGSALTKLGD
jgi:Hypervirulence associated proteins TUDOR domain